MCIGFWSLDDPNYCLILCANRDEFLARPTLPARFHNFGVRLGPSDNDVQIPSVSGGFILSGIDLKGGGTWLGINRAGQIGFLTNIIEPSDGKKFAVSRGSFAQEYLSHHDSTPSPLLRYLSEHYDGDTTHLESAGFNFTLFAPKPSRSSGWEYEAALLTNHGGHGRLTYRPISADECHCGGISNAIDGSPVDGLGQTGPWPKTDVGRARFEGILKARKSSSSDLTDDEQEVALIEALMELMGWSPPSFHPSQDHLRDSIFIPPFNIVPCVSTPINPDASPEPPSTQTSKLCGTRITTVILIRRDGKVCFVERDRATLKGDGGPGDVTEVFGSRGKSETQRLYRFSLQ
ncbi:NRDE protein-domain-containing protein [Cantharellus anzutake]|uniref:NRDE protein-domain-containing protein n=1 Tax=Cantharellus anzutake TaxID=1750568 RepID=UPI001903EC30|nr:NRDE protein-domain-containing protein [Cantharellus anzutake]KAF8334735.1 NRDE protein-domain-containing protein [Cantharellus anzutake]